MRGEVGSKPIITHDDDKQSTIPTKPNTPSQTVKKTNYIYFTGISGNAYEQIHAEKGKIVDYNDNPRVQYVQVVVENDNGQKYITYTDSNGNYVFNNLIPGKYKLTFKYGHAELLEDEAIKTNLKYNGLDYIASSAGVVKNQKTITEKTIMISKSGATEIMLAIDCSNSAWSTILPNGQSRLEKQKEAAKELINSLLDEENVYIGIVCFAGNGSAYRAISETNNRELLIQTLDEIKSGGKCSYEGLSGGTNIIDALNKSNSSFISNDSNKWIILLSDGAPTTDGKDQIYNDDTDEDLIKKLKSIALNTQKVIKNLSNKNINICSFIVDSTDELEKKVVESIFSYEGGKGYFHSSDEEATKIIKEDILKHIITNTDEKENTKTKPEIEEFDGIEDKARRAEVNGKYQKYNYQKISNIEDLINNYNSTKNERAKNFLNDTYMTVTVSQKYTIDKCYKEDKNYWYFSLSGKKSKKKYNEITKSSYTNQNLELRKREQLDVEVIIKTTGYRLRLSNGTIYKQLMTNGVIDKNLPKGKIIKNLKDIKENMYIESIREQLMYGSQIDIEYTIILKNISGVPISDVQLISYLTDMSEKNGAILEFDSKMKMITNQCTNAQYGWKKHEKNYFINSVSEDTLKNMNNNYYITLDTANSLALRNGTIGANGERYIKLILTKKLSNAIKNDNTDFSNSVEIISYSNELGIRMRKTFKDGTTINVIPGNSIEGENRKETDYSQSMRILVIPPTGKKTDNYIALTIFIECMLIVLLREYRKRKN